MIHHDTKIDCSNNNNKNDKNYYNDNNNNDNNDNKNDNNADNDAKLKNMKKTICIKKTYLKYFQLEFSPRC